MQDLDTILKTLAAEEGTALKATVAFTFVVATYYFTFPHKWQNPFRNKQKKTESIKPANENTTPDDMPILAGRPSISEYRKADFALFVCSLAMMVFGFSSLISFFAIIDGNFQIVYLWPFLPFGLSFYVTRKILHSTDGGLTFIHTMGKKHPIIKHLEQIPPEHPKNDSM